MRVTTYRTERTRQGIDGILVLLLASAVICLPLAVRASEWVPEASRLLYVSLWALLTGLVLGRSRLPVGVSAFLGVLLGLEYAIQFATKLLPRLALVLGDIGRAATWLWELVRYQRLGEPAPFARTAAFISQRFSEAVRGVMGWAAATQAGATSRDNTVLWFLVALGIWLVTWYAAYELFRTHRAFLALLPLAVAIVANVSLTYLGLSYVQVFFALFLLIMVAANAERMQEFWARSGLDYSPELRRDTLLAGTGVAGLVLVVALLMPYVTYNRAVFFFWDRVGPTLTHFYERLDDAFAGRNPLPTATPNPKDVIAHEVRAGSLPTKDVVLTVRINEPAPPSPEEIENLLAHGDEALIFYPPKHYWRERTYDVYTGHGWDSRMRETTRLPADVAWSATVYPYTLLTQTYSIAGRPGPLAYGVNEPDRVVDQEYEVLTRGNGDLIGLAVGARVYTVVSRLPAATVADMRGAEEEYPPYIADAYLALPAIPERVRAKAEEIVAASGARTRYEKARAIEAYLRSFDYDLNVEPPALDQDVVDYFLFDARRGYCDYSASAMVVMLRAVGVAARYASGYGMGTYDYKEGVYVVAGTNAHAWPEVYFPGHGWVEFEPTPTERVFQYVGGDASEVSNGTAPDAPTASSRQQVPLWLWGLGLLLVMAFVIVWPPRWFSATRRNPTMLVRHSYGRIVRAARWAGIEPEDGQTPSEFLHRLAEQIDQRLGNRVGALSDIRLVAEAYQQARYGRAPISIEHGLRVTAAGRRLRPVLLHLALSRRGRVPTLPSDTEMATAE